MIYGIFHKGSGLGNQLHRYIAIRILASEKGYEFGMIAPNLFKGKSFMDLSLDDFSLPYRIEEPAGKVIPLSKDLVVWEEWNKYIYDPEFNFAKDNSIIDGSLEDERYFGHKLKEIDQWLKVEPISVPDDVCLIGFRGGEYYAIPELGLPKEYFNRAIDEMKKINPNLKFEVHTDDIVLAKQFFPEMPLISNIGVNWRTMRYAKYAIIANSSFYILPRLLNGGITIAPHYWNRYNIKKWDYPQNYYSKFLYI